MNPQEYIINELESFIKRFSKVRVRYEYNTNSLVHLIEIVPNNIYHLDENYILWESEMFDNFVDVYPAENICFISDDALVGIEKAMYVKEGLDYAPFSTKEESYAFSLNLLSLQQNILHNIGDAIHFTEKKVYDPIEDVIVTEEYSMVCQTYSLAA